MEDGGSELVYSFEIRGSETMKDEENGRKIYRPNTLVIKALSLFVVTLMNHPRATCWPHVPKLESKSKLFQTKTSHLSRK
jgi:hypothetical protein